MRSDARKRLQPSTITFDVPWAKPPLSANRVRGNPYARAAEVKTAHEVMVFVLAGLSLPKLVGAEVTLHYRPKTRIRRDADGLFPTLKVCLDSLVRGGVLPDDSWVCVPAATCRIHEPSGDPRMWLELSSITHFGAGVA